MKKTTEKGFWLPDGFQPPNQSTEFLGASDFVEWRQDDVFHINHVYEKNACETVFCKSCGGDHFKVGTGRYYTAIKCVECEYEVMIHEG